MQNRSRSPDLPVRATPTKHAEHAIRLSKHQRLDSDLRPSDRGPYTLRLRHLATQRHSPKVEFKQTVQSCLENSQQRSELERTIYCIYDTGYALAEHA
jgi:hypothetical protein